MTAALAPIAGFLLLFARTAAFLTAAPLVGDRSVPARLRVAAAVAITVGLAAAVPTAALPLDVLFARLPLEILIGLAVGFLLRVLLAGAEAGGQLIGVHLELTFAASYDPRLAEEALPTRRIVAALLGIGFLSAGGLEACVAFLARAPRAELLGDGVLRALLAAGGDVLRGAIAVSGPVLVATVAANVAVGVAGRAAPAFNVFSVMLAGSLIVGWLALRAGAPVVSGAIAHAGEHAVSSLLALVGGGP